LWNLVLEKSCSFVLNLWSEHLNSLKNLDDALNTIMDEDEDLLDGHKLHVHELVNWVLRVLHFDALEQLHVEDVAPKLADWSQLLRPFLLIESELLGTDSLKALQARDDLSTVEPLHTSVDVGWKSKHRWLVRLWQLVDQLEEVSAVVALRGLDHVGQGLLSLECSITEHLLHVGTENSHIVLIVDSTSIDGVLKDTVDLLPLDTSSLCLIKDVDKDALSSLEISIGELIVLDPTLWDVGPSLLNDGVEPGQDEQELHLVWLLTNSLLWSDILECPLQVVSHTWWCLVGDLQTRLEKDRWELGVWLTGKPKSEVLVWSQHLEFLLKDREPWCD